MNENDSTNGVGSFNELSDGKGKEKVIATQSFGMDFCNRPLKPKFIQRVEEIPKEGATLQDVISRACEEYRALDPPIKEFLSLKYFMVMKKN